MQILWQDLRYGVRMLIRRPGFTVAAVLTLALGIGANTAIFSAVNAVLLRPLPVLEPDRLVFLFSGSQRSPYSTSSYPDYIDFRDGNEVFSGLIAFCEILVSARAEDRAESITGSIVSGNFFDVLGVPPALGRTFSEEEDRVPGANPVVVISHGLWQRNFGGSPEVIGQQLTLNGHSFTIIGVAPAGFNGPELFETRDIWVPMMTQSVVRPPRAGFSGEMNADLLSRRGARWMSIIGRLKPDVSIEQAQAGLDPIADRLRQAYPEENEGRIVTLFPVNKVDPRAYTQLKSIAALLLAVVAMVLLIACANVANLMLARASARRKEIAVRLALGASRRRIVRQMLTESTLPALLGGVVGLLIATWMVDVLKSATPTTGIFSFSLDYRFDLRVFAFTLGLSVLTGIIFGLAPALQASKPDLVPALKNEALIPGNTHRRLTLRNLLVVSQVALSFVLLIAAGLFLRSLDHAQRIDFGFNADKVLTAPLNINLLRYTKPQGQEFYDRLIERVEGLPGVESASLARIVPMSGSGRTSSLLVEGQGGPDNVSRSEGTRSDDESRHTVSSNVIRPRYFPTMGIPLLRGRDFTPLDREGAPQVAIVNESFTRRHFADQEPLGRRISFGGQRGPWMEIVGVVRDIKYRTVGEGPTPFAYVPLAQNHETGMTLHVRAAGDPMTLASAIRNHVQELDKNLPVTDLQPASALISSSLFAARMGAILLGVFGLLALVLAAIGLYGVMSYSVSQRTREIGVRMALGARASEVLLIVIKEGMSLVFVGMAIGWVTSALATRVLSNFFYGISRLDAPTYIAIPAILALVALLANYVPARRAAKVDPIMALRYE